ncbi:MAG: DUF4178 domain-containing protein [Bryobacteraceae bacterium]
MRRSFFCPSCGARVEFMWSSSVQTTCEYCHSILVRRDVDLTLVGKVSDLPPDVSPIQIGTEGRIKNQNFTVAGRIIYEYDGGAWNEWHLILSDGNSAWLSDAQAQYAVTVERAITPLPDQAEVYPGKRYKWDSVIYEATAITHANYRGVQGELPFEYWDKERATFVDLRAPSGGFATLDYSDEVPKLYVGDILDFDLLQMTNLRTFEGWS